MSVLSQLQGGTKQQNGCVRWTMAQQLHCPKKPPRKSSALHFAMASFSATSSTKSILALFSRFYKILYLCFRNMFLGKRFKAFHVLYKILINAKTNPLEFKVLSYCVDFFRLCFSSNYFLHVSIWLHEFQNIP